MKTNQAKKSRLFTLLFLLLALSPILGQNTSAVLSGQILDISTNKGLSFASVSILKKVGDKSQFLTGATADENGNFKIANVALGEMIIRVSFISYKTEEKAILVSVQP